MGEGDARLTLGLRILWVGPDQRILEYIIRFGYYSGKPNAVCDHKCQDRDNNMRRQQFRQHAEAATKEDKSTPSRS